jgi:hypothetical protein
VKPAKRNRRNPEIIKQPTCRGISGGGLTEKLKTI